jgi:hypothetical protein
MGLRSPWFAVPVLALLVVALVPVPARAEHRDREWLEIRGVVVAIERWGGTFHVREERRFADRGLWQVVVTRRTDFDVRRWRGRDDDDDRDFDRFRRLNVGDFVEVEGRLIRHRTILAREVDVFVFRRPRPLPPVVIAPAPIIVFPRPGLVVGGDFVLIGRVTPRAQVLVVIVTTHGGILVWKHEAWAQADDDGHFRMPIRPGFAGRGLQHHITVKARHGGADSPPAVVVVNQN